jgi:hypothetical protein
LSMCKRTAVEPRIGRSSDAVMLTPTDGRAMQEIG